MSTVNSEVLQVLQAVSDEVTSAMNQHGPMRSRHEAFGVIAEELDEFWEEVKLNPAKMTETEQLAWLRRQHKELVQTAAMCVRAIVDLELPNHKYDYSSTTTIENFVNAQLEPRDVPNPPGPKYF